MKVINSWKRAVGAALDRFAVPVAAGVVAWIGTEAWAVQHAPAAIVESAVLRYALQAVVAFVAFIAALRVL